MELDSALIGKEFIHFKGGLWVRPAEMFFEKVDKPGYSGPRFRIEEDRRG